MSMSSHVFPRQGLAWPGPFMERANVTKAAPQRLRLCRSMANVQQTWPLDTGTFWYQIDSNSTTV